MNLPSTFVGDLFLLEPYIHDGWDYIDATNPKLKLEA